MTPITKSIWRPFFASWAALSLLAALWSFATPIGASPDEPSHLIRAASVATGQIAPFEHKGTLVQVPEWVWYSESLCFAFHSDETPACVPPDTSNQERSRTIVSTTGRYNPLYYAAVGWPALIFTSSAGLYAMRLVSDLLTMAFLGFSFALISRWRRPTLALVGLATAITPMVLFLGGVVNPNALEITATLATFVAMLTIVKEPSDKLLKQRVLLLFVAASVAANSRPLSPVWVAVAILVPLMLFRRGEIRSLLRTRPIRAAIVGCAVTFAAAIGWWIFSNPLNVGQPGTIAPVGIGTSHIAGFLGTLASTFYYGEQMVGIFGWLDTPAPPAVYFVWAALVGVLVLLAMVVLRRRALLFAVSLLVAFLLLPAIIQGYYITTGGLIWQGRYILPVFACAMVGIGAVLTDVVPIAPAVRTRLFGIIVGVWTAAQIIAFATVIKRYAIGASASWSAITHPKWSAPGGNLQEIAVFSVLTIAAGVAVVLWHRRAVRAEVESPREPIASDTDRAVPVSVD